LIFQNACVNQLIVNIQTNVVTRFHIKLLSVERILS
jgi:hypothetical protein